MTRHTQDVTADRLLRCAAVFLPAALPRDGRIAFWAPGPGTGEDLAGPDVDTETFKNDSEANALLKREPRKGYELPEV